MARITQKQRININDTRMTSIEAPSHFASDANDRPFHRTTTIQTLNALFGGQRPPKTPKTEDRVLL